MLVLVLGLPTVGAKTVRPRRVGWLHIQCAYRNERSVLENVEHNLPTAPFILFPTLLLLVVGLPNRIKDMDVRLMPAPHAVVGLVPWYAVPRDLPGNCLNRLENLAPPQTLLPADKHHRRKSFFTRVHGQARRVGLPGGDDPPLQKLPAELPAIFRGA